jgi:hypothetical protein
MIFIQLDSYELRAWLGQTSLRQDSVENPGFGRGFYFKASSNASHTDNLIILRFTFSRADTLVPHPTIQHKLTT